MKKKHISYKNSNIYFYTKGSGNPIIFIHGLLENSTIWNFISFDLAKQNNIICVDLPGHGESDSYGYINTMEDMAEIINLIIIKLKIFKVTLIGHSLGGYIALAFIEKFPKKINKLCFINSTSKKDSLQKIKLRLRALKIKKKDFKTFVKVYINNLFSIKIKNKKKLQIKILKNEAIKTKFNSYLAIIRGVLIRKDREHILASKRYEKVFISSYNDKIINFKTSKQEALNTNSFFIELPGGHMSFIENPNKLKTILIDFISN